MFCSKCGSPNDDAARFCAKCGAPMGAQASPGPAAAPPIDAGTMRGAAPAPSTASVTGKNPVVALILSIFLGGLGVGQFYNGDWKKGLAMAGISIFFCIPTGGLATLAVWIWSMIDAYMVASGQWKAW